MRTVEQVMTEMEAAHIPAVPYHELGQCPESPHSGNPHAALNRYGSARSETVVGQPQSDQVVKNPREDRDPRASPQKHNLEIYGRLLGYDKETLDELIAKGII